MQAKKALEAFFPIHDYDQVDQVSHRRARTQIDALAHSPICLAHDPVTQMCARRSRTSGSGPLSGRQSSRLTRSETILERRLHNHSPLRQHQSRPPHPHEFTRINIMTNQQHQHYQIALYFGWMGLYTSFLGYAAIAGLICWIHRPIAKAARIVFDWNFPACVQKWECDVSHRQRKIYS